MKGKKHGHRPTVSPRRAPLQAQNPLDRREPGSTEEDPATVQPYPVNLSQPSPKKLQPFTRVTVFGGKKNNHMIQELDTGSELTLIPGDPKCHCGQSE